MLLYWSYILKVTFTWDLARQDWSYWNCWLVRSAHEKLEQWWTNQRLQGLVRVDLRVSAGSEKNVQLSHRGSPKTKSASYCLHPKQSVLKKSPVESNASGKLFVWKLFARKLIAIQDIWKSFQKEKKIRLLLLRWDSRPWHPRIEIAKIILS